MNFFLENIGSILTAVALILILAAAITVIYKRRKSGKSACGGDCAFCMTDCKQKDDIN